MYYEWVQKNKRAIAITAVTVVVAIIIWSIATVVSRIGKIPVTISPVPGNAKVTLNGENSGGGTQWLNAGTYTLRVEKDGYQTREKQLIVTKDKQQNVAAMSLTPESDAAKKWADAHQNDYTANQAFGTIEAQANGEYFANKHPIVKQLPYEDPYYQINYTQNDSDNTVGLTITAPSPRYRYYAVQKIRELGFDPTDYRITFADYKNPLVKEDVRE